MRRTIDFPKPVLAGLALAAFLAGVAPPPVAGAGDPFAGAPRMTSAGLVAAVLARSPDLPAMEAAWEAARARIGQAGALDDPMLSYAVAPNTLGEAATDPGQNLSLSQRLPWPGKRALRRDVARSDADAAREGVEDTALRLAEAARAAFADWYFVHAAIRVNEADRALLAEFRAVAEVRYAAGTASRQDALRAEVEEALLAHRGIVLERQRREALATLNTLLERPPDAPLPPPTGLAETAAPPAAPRLRAAALDAHPGLRALDARIDAARRRVELAGRDFRPDFQLTAGYNSLWAREEQRLTVGAGVNLPLTGRRRANLAGARAEFAAVEAERRGLAARIAGEVQRARDRVEESAHVRSLYRDRLVPLAEENVAAARADYEAGGGDFLDLVDAEHNLTRTRLEAERALADHHRNLAALERATGGAADLFGSAAQGDGS